MRAPWLCAETGLSFGGWGAGGGRREPRTEAPATVPVGDDSGLDPGGGVAVGAMSDCGCLVQAGPTGCADGGDVGGERGRMEADPLAGDTGRTEVTFPETGKTVVWDGGDKRSVGDILSLPSCQPLWHGRQIMRKSLPNEDSTAAVLSARKQDG